MNYNFEIPSIVPLSDFECLDNTDPVETRKRVLEVVQTIQRAMAAHPSEVQSMELIYKALHSYLPHM